MEKKKEKKYVSTWKEVLDFIMDHDNEVYEKEQQKNRIKGKEFE